MRILNDIVAVVSVVLAGAFAFVSPTVSVLCGLVALVSLVQSIRNKRVFGELVMQNILLEDNRFPKVICNNAGVIISYNILGGEFFGTAHIFDKIKDDICQTDAASQDNFAKMAAGLETGLDVKATLKFTAKAVPVYVVDMHKIKGRNWWLVTAKDVTAKVGITNFLQKEREELAAFLDKLPIGLFSTDAKGNILVAGGTFCKWLEISGTTIVGLNIDEFTVGQERPNSLLDWQGDVSFKSRGGNFFKAYLRQFVSIENGQTIVRSAVIRDVSTALDADKELEQTKRQVALLFGDTPFGIALADKQGIISEVNPALKKMLSKPEENIVNRSIFAALGKDEDTELQQKMDKVLGGFVTGARCEVRVEGESSAGDKIFAIFIRPIRMIEFEQEKITGLIFHFFDTTEWKNLELQFEQAQKMQAMGQLAGGIAHDFNNILTGILGFCDFLLSRHTVGDPSYPDIMQIQQNSARAANLVRQLLAFSRKQSLTPKIVDTSVAFADIMDMLRQLIGGRVEVKVDYGRDLGYVRIDQGQFEQVFMNLAVNAQYAMQDKGVITINISHYTLTEPQQNGSEIIPAGDYVRFDFSDTGSGIAKEHLKRIFEPFFSTKSDKGEGTGLGLATVYGIIRQTEGFIFVKSKLGEGTTFTILLPRFDKPKETTEQNADVMPKQVTISAGVTPPKRGKELKGLRILLAEDEAAVRLFATRALTNKGFQVVDCDCGESALAKAQEDRDFDLLLTDMTMPGMDGATLARQVKELIPPIKIIIMSGFSEDIAKGAIADDETIAFLGKPFNLEQIVKKVKEVCS